MIDKTMAGSGMIAQFGLYLEDRKSLCVYHAGCMCWFCGPLTECVKQATFPRIGGSCDDNLHSAAQPLAPPLIL